MATSEEYIQSILTNIGTIQHHRLVNEQSVNDALKDVDDAVDDVLGEINYLEEEAD